MTRDPHDRTPEDELLAERGRLLVADAVANVRAPDELRTRIALQERIHAREHTWRGRLGVLIPATFAVAAMIALVVVIAVTSGDRNPTVPAVALVALRGHEQASVPDDPRFPYRGGPGWTPSGARDDTVGGRATTTVFYRDARGREAAYAIVSGAPLDVPDGRRTTVRGVPMTVAQDGARTIVTWRRAGHTCVVSASRAVPAARLLALAAWHVPREGA